MYTSKTICWADFKIEGFGDKFLEYKNPESNWYTAPHIFSNFYQKLFWIIYIEKQLILADETLCHCLHSWKPMSSFKTTSCLLDAHRAKFYRKWTISTG